MSDTRPPDENIERLVEKYSDMLLRIAYHNTNSQSDAEDTVQSVFLKYLRTCPEFNDEGHEKAWFIRVAINHCKDLKTSAWSRKNVAFEDYMDKGHSGNIDDDRQLILEKIRALPEKYRNIIYLYYYEGYSTQEISEILNLPQNTVSSRLFRAREKLRISLEDFI